MEHRVFRWIVCAVRSMRNTVKTGVFVVAGIINHDRGIADVGITVIIGYARKTAILASVSRIIGVSHDPGKLRELNTGGNQKVCVIRKTDDISEDDDTRPVILRMSTCPVESDDAELSRYTL